MNGVRVKPWMWILMALSIFLAIAGIDPIGMLLVSKFGPGADRWGLNIILIGMIIFYSVKKK